MTRVHVKNILWVVCTLFGALFIYHIYEMTTEGKVFASLLGFGISGIIAFILEQVIAYEREVNKRSYFPPVSVPRKPRLKLVK